MKFTLDWLRTHLDTDAPLDRIAETLTALGLEGTGRWLLQATAQAGEVRVNTGELQ